MTFIAFDTETYGLELTDRMFGFSFQVQGSKAGWIDLREHDQSVLGIIQELDKLPGMVWLMHNAKFDLRRLALEGVELGSPVMDTKVLAQLADNRYSSYSLADCGARLGFDKSDEVTKWINDNNAYEYWDIPGKKQRYKKMYFDRVPPEIIAEYAKRDVEVTLKIAEKYWHEVNPEIRDQEMALTKTLFNMEQRGIAVDPWAIRTNLDKAQREQHRLLESFKHATGVAYKPSAKVLKPLFDERGIPYGRTEKGQPSFDYSVLEKLTHPLAKCILEIRDTEKEINTYYTSFLHLAHKNRIHTDFKQSGARTFRFSCANPNLQNVPKGGNIRRCFVPTPGHYFVFIDYKQMEFRMLMDYAEEYAVIKRINDGEDVHQIAAEQMGVERYKAKTIQFGLLYGMGVTTLAETLGVPVSEARELKAAYFAKHPKVKSFMDQVVLTSERRGYVKTWDGVKLHHPHDRPYSILNHLIQGGCARVIRRVMPKVEPIVEGLGHLLLQIHDELVFEMRPGGEAVIPRITKAMSSEYIPFCGVRLDVEVEISRKSWAEDEREEFSRESFA